MNKTELLAEITAAFENEPYPGNLNLLEDNSGYDLEATNIRNALKAHTWQQLPDKVMAYEQSGYAWLSPMGFKYYLPAYLCFAVRDYYEADSIPVNLIYDFTLKAEIDVLRSAFVTKKYGMDKTMPSIDWYKMDQTSLLNLNDNVQRFITRHGQFSPAQRRAIYHFLVFIQAEYTNDFPDGEPNTAIQRYWFQFA